MFLKRFSKAGVLPPAIVEFVAVGAIASKCELRSPVPTISGDSPRSSPRYKDALTADCLTHWKVCEVMATASCDS